MKQQELLARYNYESKLLDLQHQKQQIETKKDFRRIQTIMKEVSIIDDLDTWEGELRKIGDATEVDRESSENEEKLKVLEQNVLQGNNLEGTYVEPKRYSTPALTSANTAPTILDGQISGPQMNAFNP